MYKLVDMRDFMDPQQGGGVRLYPYARDLYYHPSGLLSMTIQIYDTFLHIYREHTKCVCVMSN